MGDGRPGGGVRRGPEGSGGGNREKTWLWDIKGTPCGRNDSSSLDKDAAGGQKDTDNTKNTTQNGPPRLTESGRRGVGGVGCTAKYG